MTHNSSTGLAAIFLALAASAARAQSDTLARIDSLFGRISATAPGCAVGIGRDGAPDVQRAYGLTSLDYGLPITPGTIFHAASIAKQFTAAVVVRLASAGKLSLDDDVRRYVPELPDYGARITLAHLMQHTSGLRDEGELLWLAGGRDDDPTEEADLLAMIFRQRSLNFTPGSQHLYSNTGYTLLALVVQRVSGRTLKLLAHDELFVPHGMTGTQFVDNRFDVIPGRATGYRMLRGGRWGHVAYLSDAYGAGGLFTTVGDLLRWHRRLPGDTVLWAHALRRARLTNGDSVPYSMGLEFGSVRGSRYVGHGGNAMGENAYAMRFVDRGLSVAVLCNGREIDSFTLARQTGALFIPPVQPAAPRPVDPAPVVAVSLTQLRKFAGLYYNAATLATRTVEEREGRLYWVRGAPGTPLDAVAPNRFRFPPGQPADLLFPDSVRGQQREMQVLSGGTVTSYRKAVPFSATTRLSDYAGQYRSDEIDVTLTVAAGDSGVVISTPGSWSFRAAPLFENAFAIPEAAVFEFTRRGTAVAGLVVDMSRTRQVTFRKLR